MEENRFFRFLWRGNAIFLFLAGIALTSVLLMAWFVLISDLRYEDTPPPLAETSNTAVEKEDFRVRRYNSHNNKVDDFAYYKLEYGTDSYGKLSSGSSSQTRNIAVLNLATNETKWMFPNAQQEIEGMTPIKKTIIQADGKTKTETTGQLLSVAVSGPNKSITRDLWVMRTDGTEFRKMLSDIPVRPDVEHYGNNLIKLIIETKTGLEIYALNVDTLTLGPSTKISLP